MSAKNGETRIDESSQDIQVLIDALIGSLQFSNDEKIQEFGEQLVAQWGGAQGQGEDGMLCPFHKLEGTDFVVELLDPSPEREQQLKAGCNLTQHELARLADQVEENCFQDDGTHDAWDVAKIESSDGGRAYVAQVLKDGGNWTAPECEFVGAFLSLAKAKDALKRLGYIDGDDFRRRYPLRKS